MSKALSQSKRRLKSAGITRWLFMGGCLLVAQGATAQELVSVSTTQHYANKYQPARVAPMQAQSLKLVLTELEQRYQVRFIYESDLIDQKQMSTLVSEGKTLVQCLDQLLTPLNLSYQKLDNHTYGIIKKASKEEDGQSAVGNQLELSLPNVPMQQLRSTQIAEMMNSTQLTAITVTGKVTDEKGEGIPGVNVVLKGTTTGTSTNMEGAYSLVVPDGSENGTLIFSYIGYLTEEVAISNRTTVNSQLTPDIKALSEVVVVGYGSQKKADVTGAISSVKTDELKKVATNDIAQMMQGRVAGVSVSSDGQPGASPTVRIRGVSSFGTNGTSTDPLYVVDGVPISGGIRDFNPNDIESMQVLKDASAGAIYGSRAANGVIIITTKRGVKDRPLSISLDSYYGVQNIAKRIPVTNRVEYQLLNNEMNANNPSGPLPPVPGNDMNSASFIDSVDTDWQKEAFKTGKIQNHTLNFSVGSKNTSYNLSLDYFKNEGTLVGSAPSYERYSARMNSETQKGRFKVGESIYLVHSNEDPIFHLYDGFGGLDFNQILTAAPTIAVLDPNRKQGFGGADAVITKSLTLNIPAINQLVSNKSRVNRMFADVYAEANLLKKNSNLLTYRINLAYDYTLVRDNRFVPAYDIGNFYSNSNARAAAGIRQYATGLVENTLNYETGMGKHSLKLLVGQTYQTFDNYYLSGTTSGLGEPYLPTLSNGDGNKTVSESMDKQVLVSYLGRLNYAFDDKYLITANIRRDGSSNISPQYRYEVFPSVAVAWKLHNESLFHLPAFFTELKIRAGWGQLGNQGIAPYSYQALINQNIPYAFGKGRVLGAANTVLVDPNLKWEKRTTRNIGLDGGLFGGKFDFTFEYYSNTASDILLSAPIPASTGSLPTGTGGAASIITNAAEMENSGFEFSFTYRKQAGDFTFEVSPNAYTLKNRVTKLNNEKAFLPGAGSRTEVGHEIGSHYGWVYEGIFQTKEEVKNHAVQDPNTAPGDVKFKDLDNNGVIDDKDRQYLGKSLPNLYYGLNFTAKYKGFDFTFFASGSSGNLINNSLYRGLMSGNSYGNYHEDLLNRWTPTNSNTDIPRMVLLDPNNNGRDSNRPGWLEKGNYLRINTLSFGYLLPTGPVKAFSSARIYATCQNLYTFSGYKGFNPDFQSGTLNPGFDGGTNGNSSFPKPRTLMLGIQLRF